MDKPNENFNKDEKAKSLESAAEQIALFRYALIAPVVTSSYDQASKTAYYKTLAQKEFVLPDNTTKKFSAKTFQKWERLWSTGGGLTALYPNERNDKGQTRKLTSEVIQKIYDIKAEYPKLNAKMIWEKLIDDGDLNPDTSVRCVQRFISEAGLKSEEILNQEKQRLAFEHPHFAMMFQADTCYFPPLPTGDGDKRHKTFVISIIDDYTRMIVASKLFFEDNAYNFQQVLKIAIMTYGIPQKVYVDYAEKKLYRINS
jgi:hypothetical protein